MGLTEICQGSCEEKVKYAYFPFYIHPAKNDTQSPLITIIGIGVPRDLLQNLYYLFRSIHIVLVFVASLVSGSWEETSIHVTLITRPPGTKPNHRIFKN